MIFKSKKRIAEWNYLGNGKFHRRDFVFSTLISQKDKKIMPIKIYKSMTVRQIYHQSLSAKSEPRSEE